MSSEYDDIYGCDEDNPNEVFQYNMGDEWLNGAYDETGDRSVCDICGQELKWNPIDQKYECPDCGQEMNRTVYFNHIGANPPGQICLTACNENYPFCKKYCPHYSFDSDDPML